jgi:ABC-type transport system involved in multi-copper enzyme maturation permease subunit
MMPAIKSEFRKLLTIRSTYFICFVSFIILFAFAFYITGWKISTQDLHNPSHLAGQVTAAVGILSTLGALVGVLTFAHEYRYNTIMYTLTASRSRMQVLVAKIISMSVFAILFTMVVGVLSPLLTVLAINIHGQTLVPQNIPYLDLLWRSLFYGWGMAMLALILTSIIRVQVGAVAALFLIPGTVEQLLGLLLKNNQVYLPFTSLGAVVDASSISHAKAALIATIYIVGGWIVASYLFVRRDAN